MGDNTPAAEHPFHSIPQGQLESLEGLVDMFRADTDAKKTNLMIGVYKSYEGEAYVLPTVKLARERIFSNTDWHHEYRGSHLGSMSFREASVRLLFGEDTHVVRDKKVVSMQALGASGACHMGALLLKNHYGPWKTSTPRVYIPQESWTNHAFVFASLGIEPKFLPYYNPTTRNLDFASFKGAICDLPPKSVIVLQNGAQNPTGCDPSPEQWEELASIFQQRGHLAFFDTAYLGFASGDMDQDMQCVRYFAEHEIPVILAATYGKCFGLYCERVGILSVVVPDQHVAERMGTQMRLQARAETGAMPDFGSTVVETILLDPELELQWKEEVRNMADQLRFRRVQLKQRLDHLGTPGDWSHVTEQRGMFSYIGLSSPQIQHLRNIHHVYIQDSGRLSIAGINASNIDHVAISIDQTVRSTL